MNDPRCLWREGQWRKGCLGADKGGGEVWGEVGRVDKKEGGVCGGGDVNGEVDGDQKELGMGEAVRGEGETERGRRRGKRKGEFTDGYDGMPGL